MDIAGPVKIGVLDKADGQGRELHFDFRPEYRALGLQEQARQMGEYLQSLASEIASRKPEDPNRAGMLIVQQVLEQMLPYIQAGEMAMNDTIIVEIEQSPSISLVDLLN